MLFNSFDFGFFLVIVYTVYWLLGRDRRTSQNIVLLASSYVFYGLWDWRFLRLLLASSLIDYIAGRAISGLNHKASKKLWLFGSLLWNLGVLFTFKYFNFFVGEFTALFSSEGVATSFTIWNIIIPLGLSFYTFQTMSYTIDVYKGKIQPTKNVLEFLCFVSFFPQLVAGPIERANFLIPQFENKRLFNFQQTKEGLRLILWGLFKKILVADKLGIAVTMVFEAPENYGTIMLGFAAFLFCFQLYCDFSGYVDIARGTAKLFGFELSENFKIFYLSKSASDFYQRWHITLTRWFTNYVYIPLLRFFKSRNNFIKLSCLLLTMGLVGLWHGSNWTFIAFGLYTGSIMVLERIPFGENKFTVRTWLAQIPVFFTSLYILFHFSIASIFFRSKNIQEAWFILKRIFSFTEDEHLTSLIGSKLYYLVFLILAEILTRHKSFPLKDFEKLLPRPLRWVFYYILIILIVRYAEPKEAFIYFQF